jgi:crotonobetainyl-CoA:carnitine CoA-transferase CaiB-like acyl-CoA transferase
VTAPLAGIKVVEIASFVAVPAAGALLADMGADVIKVETPWGEIYRYNSPRMAGLESGFPAGPAFQMDNRGKRSIGLDLALPQAQEALRRVIEGADVVITNVLPARLERYGLDPETLRAARPELIFARLSGYGPDGDRANDPAFDYTAFWSLSGLMDQMRDEGVEPSWMRPGIGDHSASMAMVVGIIGALRVRDQTGEGQVIDVALQQIGHYINGNDMAMTLAAGEAPPRHDRSAPRNPLWNHYACADGRRLFLVMIDSDRYWPLLARAIGRPELAGDERFANGFARFRNAAELVALLDGVFAERTLDEWAEPLESERLIWAPIKTLAEAAEDANSVEAGMFATVEHPRHGTFRTVAPPFRMSGHALVGDAPAPELAEHTAEVLQAAGVDDETLALLLASVS